MDSFGEIYYKIKDEITALKIAQKQSVHYELGALKDDVNRHHSEVNAALSEISNRFTRLDTKIKQMTNDQDTKYNQLSSTIKSNIRDVNDKYTKLRTELENKIQSISNQSSQKATTQSKGFWCNKLGIFCKSGVVKMEDAQETHDKPSMDNVSDKGATNDNSERTQACEETKMQDNVEDIYRVNDIQNDNDVHDSIDHDIGDEYHTDLIVPDIEYTEVRRKIIFGLKEDILDERYIERYAIDIGDHFKQDLQNKLDDFGGYISETDLKKFGDHIEDNIKMKQSKIDYLFDFVSDDERTFYGKINIKLQQNEEKDDEYVVNTSYYFDLFYIKR